MSVRTNDPRPPEIYKPALCAAGCGKEYQSICGKCNLAYCSDHLKAPHACGNWPATRLATPEPDPAKSDTPQYAVGQQLAPGLVVVHEETLKKLQGPFTCGHPPEFAGGACAACHALALEKLDAVNLQNHELQKFLWDLRMYLDDPLFNGSLKIHPDLESRLNVFTKKPECATCKAGMLLKGVCSECGRTGPLGPIVEKRIAAGRACSRCKEDQPDGFLVCGSCA